MRMAVGNEEKSEVETELVVDCNTNNNGDDFIAHDLSWGLF